jgi:nucleotide-binding universal stress UspA family protein
MAGHFGANLRLIHVVGMGERLLPEELIPRRRMDLDQFAANDLKYFTNDRLCVYGDDPAVAITSTAAEWGADLIMMPTHGAGIFRRLLLGSVTAKVLHDVTCPVWTSVHAEMAPRFEEIHCRRVLCAIDLSPRSKFVLDWAAALATEFSAQLAIVCSTGELPRFYGDSNMKWSWIESMENYACIEITKLREDLAMPCEAFIREGNPASVVEEIARGFGADLLVIGRHSGEEQDGFRPTAVESILQSSPCPVISI